MNSYDLSRNFWNWAFDNPELISPNHAAIYFFAIEHCNRLGWKKKFGFPSQMTMDAIGIKKHQTYIKYFNDLVEYGFFKMIQKSKNQYSANIISLMYAMPKKGKALDKAIITHAAKQTQSNGQSNSSIDKPVNKEPINKLKKEKVFIPPSQEMVCEYFKENKYKEETAIKAFKFYDVAGWKDSKGNKIKNWKQKMIGVWFTPENKSKKELSRQQRFVR